MLEETRCSRSTGNRVFSAWRRLRRTARKSARATPVISQDRDATALCAESFPDEPIESRSAKKRSSSDQVQPSSNRGLRIRSDTLRQAGSTSPDHVARPGGAGPVIWPCLIDSISGVSQNGEEASQASMAALTARHQSSFGNCFDKQAVGKAADWMAAP